MEPTSGPTPWDRAARLGPGFVDLLVVAGVGLCVVADVYSLVGTDRTGLRLLATFAALGAVVVRRRFPLGSYALVIAVILGLVALRAALDRASVSTYDYPLLAPVAALGAMTTTLVRRQPAATAVACAAAGAGALVVLLTWPLGTNERILLAIGFGGTYAVALGAGIYLRDLGRRGRLAAEAARRDERLDLARELHDLVAHHVTGIVVQAQAARVVADRDPEAAGAALDRIEGAGKEALTAMRRLVGSLRHDAGVGDPAAPIAPLVGLGDLGDLVAAATGPGLAVRLQLGDGVADRVPGSVAASTHRIVQESLTNVRRHAVGATSALVDVRLVGADLLVTVTDDGRLPVGGVRPDRQGYGLVGMTERALALGGELAAGPVAPPAHGWSVQARFPLDGVGP